MLSGFAACKKKNRDKGKDTVQKEITKEGDLPRNEDSEKEVPAPKQAPIGTWDIPVPEINPLGAQDLYSGTSYTRGSYELKYIQNFAEMKQLIKGEIWCLSVDNPSEDALASLKTYAKSLGAQIMDSEFEDSFIFSLSKEGNGLWWGNAILNDYGYDLNVIKQIELPVGKEVTLQTDGKEDTSEIQFITRSKGEHFQSLKVTIPNGEVELRGEENYKSMMTEKRVYYRKHLSSIKTNSYVLDDIPQGEGIINWTISWDEESRPQEITILLEESFEIPYVKRGDELGAIKVCNLPFGEVFVEPLDSVEYVHRDGFSMEADITAEGDCLFWLPAGLWNLVMEDAGTGYYEGVIRFVPVNAGEITTVTLPESYRSACYSLNSIFGSGENLTGGITIDDAREVDGKGIIKITVDDPLSRDIFPDKKNTTILESGQQVNIIDINRNVFPPSVVLVLDSSGSMKEAMDKTLEAAKNFIQGLPDGSFIQVIDFDTEVKVLEGESKETVIKNLSKIKSGGYTLLFDATIKGLELLEGKERPALVVFADGEDSSMDDSGKGSYYTIDDVIYEAENSMIPIYTIGFGDDLDEASLEEIAKKSGGKYYPAKDEEALVNVFNAINSKFGNHFEISYERPKEAALANTPFVSLVIDASGSMDTDPEEEEGCGYRIDKVKAIFHEFVKKLPEDVLMQLTTFQTGVVGGNIISLEQLTTMDKSGVLQGIGEMRAYGGTPILDVLNSSLINLISVPSNNKVIVFLTDAALEVDEEYQSEFEELLTEIDREGITVLWVGMGVDNKKDVFEKAARISGGKYVISEDSEIINKNLEEILNTIKTKKEAERLPISIRIMDTNKEGEKLNYITNSTVPFSSPPKSNKIIEPEPVKIETGKKIKRYDAEIARLLTGNSLPSKETIISKRMDFSASDRNQAMKLSVNESIHMSKLKGLSQYPIQFLALSLNMKNVHKDNYQYLIPNMSSHFYININNEGMYPASIATWLSETPISEPGEYAITIEPREEKSGIITFLVPDEPITQMSLHFYDTVYGHITIPLVGTVNKELMDLEQLPQNPPVNIADSFTMTMTSYSDVKTLDQFQAPENSSFRVLEAEFSSNVQALLDIEPENRLWLKIDTQCGPFMTQMNGVTGRIPFGFMEARMLAPASCNKVRMAYQIADSLKDAKTEIFGDIRDGSLTVPIISGKSYGSKGMNRIYSGDGVSLRVNQLSTLEKFSRYNESWVVADLTIIDEKDGWGTLLSSDAFKLVKEGVYINQSERNNNTFGLDDFASWDSDDVRNAEILTKDLLYGIDDDWPVFDQGERRGFVLFYLPDDSRDWCLQSPYFKDLNLKVSDDKFNSPDLLVSKYELEDNNQDFMEELEKAVEEAIKDYQSIKSSENKAGFTNSLSLSKGDGKNNIPVPTIVYHGATKIKSVHTLEEAIALLQGLKCLLVNSNNLQYSPEAVITQGWGTQVDLFHLSMGLFAKAGVVPMEMALNLTEAGRNKLDEICKNNNYGKDWVPGISYTDKNGNARIFVIPFMKDITELKGLVYLSANSDFDEPGEEEVRITVSVEAEFDADANTGVIDFDDIGSVLGGGEDGEGTTLDSVVLLSKEIPLTKLCNDAIEIGYMKAGRGKGTRYMSTLITSEGITAGDYFIDTGEAKLQRLVIEIQLPEERLIHYTSLKEDEELDHIAHTIGINLPDLTIEAGTSLEEAFEKEYAAASDPDAFSVLKWYGRNILNRFIYSQSIYDRDMSEKLDLTMGRINKERCIMVTSRMAKDQKMRTTIDLMQASNECHYGEETSVIAYNLNSGIFLSSLEGSALTGEDKIDYADLWAMAPEDTSLIVIFNDEESRYEILDLMKEAGIYPAHLLERIEDTEKVIITPDKAIPYLGEERWAWLEIDPETYETISVFDTGEHAGMVDYIWAWDRIQEGLEYVFGAFLGVDVSLWSVASMALELDDYEDILDEAVNMTIQIGEMVNKVLKKELYSFTFVGKNGPIKGEIKIGYDLSRKVEFGQNVINFKEGYEDGMNYYFSMAYGELEDDDEGDDGDEGNDGDDGGEDGTENES